MSAGGEVVVGLVILLGLAGTVVQVLPGPLLVLGAVAVWAVLAGGTAAWVAFAVAALAVAAAEVAKWLLAGRHLVRAGVRSRTLLVGGALGIVGFFVIPVVGLVIGFVGGVYLAELATRSDHAAAWAATKVALQAAGISILVELAGGLVAATAWLVAVLRFT